MDNLFQDLNNSNKSVHLSNFPNYDLKLVDNNLENKIRLSQKICSLALSLRKKEKIKVRQPLPKILIPFKNQDEKNSLIEISEFIKSEINVKEIELISDSSEILIKKAKPNFKVLGPKYGKDIQEIVQLVNSLKMEEINALENGKNLNIEGNNRIYVLNSEDVEIYYEDIALDTNIDEFLKNEGISREIVNKIQNLRKESNFNVSDKIIIEMERNNLIEKAIFANIEYVKNETLAKELNFLDNLDSITKIQFDNFSLNVKIYKIN